MHFFSRGRYNEGESGMIGARPFNNLNVLSKHNSDANILNYANNHNSSTEYYTSTNHKQLSAVRSLENVSFYTNNRAHQTNNSIFREHSISSQ